MQGFGQLYLNRISLLIKKTMDGQGVITPELSLNDDQAVVHLYYLKEIVRQRKGV
jgi:hypothetical protein